MGTVFGVCKTNGDEIWHGKSGSTHEMVISGLYYGDIKIEDTFAYEYTRMPQPTGLELILTQLKWFCP